MSECLECGESADNIHPEYPGDRLCDPCYGSYCDEQVEFWIRELADHITGTDYKPYSTEWKLSDYTDKVDP